MRIKTLVLLVLVLSIAGPTIAGGLTTKERSGCAGAYQLWTVHWNFTSPHDTWTTFTLWTKLSASSEYLNAEHSSHDAYDCVFVSNGTPLGSASHNWRSTATKSGSSPYNTNAITITYNASCQEPN